MRNAISWSLLLFSLCALTWNNIPEPRVPAVVPTPAPVKSVEKSNVQTTPIESPSKNPYTPDRPDEDAVTYDSEIS